MRSFTKKHPILCFVLMVLVPVHGILWPLLLTGTPQQSLQPLKILFAFLPTTSALIITWLIKGDDGVRELWRSTFLKEGRIKYYGTALLSIAILGAIAMAVRFVYDGFWPSISDYPDLGTSLLLAPFLLLFPGFTEEFGWRGFLQQRLQGQTGVFLASLITGIVWGTWHGMDFLMGNWPSDTFNVLVFFTYIVGTSIVIGYLYECSGRSIFVAIVAHFSANIVNFFLPVWNTNAGLTTPIIFVGLLWLTALVLLVFELRKKRFSQRLSSYKAETPKL